MATNLSFNKRLVGKWDHEPVIGAIFYPQKFINLLTPMIGDIILMLLVF
jgi:hypothetical protein